MEAGSMASRIQRRIEVFARVECLIYSVD
jgi:transposase